MPCHVNIRSSEKGSKLFFPSFFTVCEIWTIKRQQMAKMGDRVPTERLGISRLSSIFLKIYPFETTSKFQE